MVGIPAFLYSLEIPCFVVRNNLVPLIRRRAGDECDNRLGVAHVEYLMRHARLNVDEIAGLIFDYLFKPFTEFVTHFAFDDVENYFEADMNVRVRNAAWRNRGNIGRQIGGAHVLA